MALTDYVLQGQMGGTVLSAGQGGPGNYRWIQFTQDTVLDGITSNLANDANLLGPVFPAGLGIGGKITYLSVGTGQVIAYYE